MDLQKVKEALEIAHDFCGNHTADECPDSIAIPVQDALREVNKAIAEFEKPVEDAFTLDAIVQRISERAEVSYNTWSDAEADDYVEIDESDTRAIIQQYAESYHAKKCAECKALDALKIAREAMKERRSYCDAWEYKYKDEWDNEDGYINDAIAKLEAAKNEH